MERSDLKKYSGDQLNDLWLRIIGLPLIAIAATYGSEWLFFGINAESQFKLFALAVLNSSVTWQVSRQIILWARKRFPGVKNTRDRIIVQFVLYTLTVAVVTALYVFFTDYFKLFNVFRWNSGNIVLIFVMSLFFSYSIGGVYEAVYFFRHWKRTTQETEQLKRESLQSQFESLKNQVNPHFLFNSLNSLSSLIEEDTDKAEQFVHEMSQVYRYLLQTNDRPLTTVMAELNFIQAYFYLLKTRFSEALQVQVNIPDRYIDWQIPPLTLQMLVENAVKHNVVSSAKPLQIKIYVNENYELVVANNLQRKTQAVLSNKIGLENISVKYKLLNQPDIAINETATQFEVRVPLIAKDVVIDSVFENEDLPTIDYN